MIKLMILLSIRENEKTIQNVHSEVYNLILTKFARIIWRGHTYSAEAEMVQLRDERATTLHFNNVQIVSENHK